MGKTEKTGKAAMNRSTTNASAPLHTAKDATDRVATSTCMPHDSALKALAPRASFPSSSHVPFPDAPLTSSPHVSFPSSAEGNIPGAVPVAVGITIVRMADSIPSDQGIKTVRLPEDLMATPAGTLRLSEGSSVEGKTSIGRYSRQSDLARTLLGNGVPGVGLVNTVAGSRQEQIPQGRDQFYRDSSVDNLNASPISNNVVELLLSE